MSNMTNIIKYKNSRLILLEFYNLREDNNEVVVKTRFTPSLSSTIRRYISSSNKRDVEPPHRKGRLSCILFTRQLHYLHRVELYNDGEEP